MILTNAMRTRPMARAARSVRRVPSTNAQTPRNGIAAQRISGALKRATVRAVPRRPSQTNVQGPRAKGLPPHPNEIPKNI